ncbi:hypothetical protein Clacol_001810 [Clathrus columnatus]|uniref:Uncharacterized protein n=1 Tax=Clathrus columnatus TaxID=1419009 RepID=A0AAV4ZZ38_9AGAM|nr:hypothetical protein Clacol_001810 [Clathrus columnatus]
MVFPSGETAIAFLILLTSGLQYLVQGMNYRSDLARIERFAAKARLAAWGPKLHPIEGKRKVKVNLRGDTHHEDDPNGKWIEMVVEGDGVYVIDSDGQLLPLNASVAEPAAIPRTWFVSLIGLLYQRIRRGSKTLIEENEEDRDTEDDDAEPEPEKVTKKSKRISQRNSTKSSSTRTSRTSIRQR